MLLPLVGARNLPSGFKTAACSRKHARVSPRTPLPNATTLNSFCFLGSLLCFKKYSFSCDNECPEQLISNVRAFPQQHHPMNSMDQTAVWRGALVQQPQRVRDVPVSCPSQQHKQRPLSTKSLGKDGSLPRRGAVHPLKFYGVTGRNEAKAFAELHCKVTVLHQQLPHSADVRSQDFPE